MKNIKSKVANVVLSAVLICGLLPASAGAQTSSAAESTSSETSQVLQTSSVLETQSNTLTDGWTQCGTCEWQIDSAKKLTIRPLGDGTSGVLENWGSNYGSVPWYSECYTIKSVEIKGSVSAPSCAYMFYNFFALTSLDISGLDSSNATTMYYMFAGCTSLTSMNLSSLNTSKVTDMGYMFYDCHSLVTADFSNFDTSNVTNMRAMFYKCTKLDTIDLSSFNTAKVTDMESMFSDCYSLQLVNLTGWSFSQVTSMDSMFNSCSMLISVPTGLTIPSSASSDQMFYMNSSVPVEIRYGGSDKTIKKYTWSSDNRTLVTGCSGEHTWGEGTNIQNPTCTEPGKKQSTCSACGAKLISSYGTPLGHAYGDPEIVFSTDGKSATATWTCANDSSHVETAQCEVTSEVTVPATCLEMGQTTYTAKVAADQDKGLSAGQNSTARTDIPALGHSFTNYISDGNATCTADGTKTAACDHGCGTTDTVTDEGSALGHSWNAPVITFNEDCTAAYAIWICKNDITHMEVATCTVTSEITQTASCTNPEITTYTASVAANEEKGLPAGSTTKAVETAAAFGHAWGEATITFSEDGKSAVATWVCTNDSTHVATKECSITSKVTTQATCITPGETTYVAAAALDGAGTMVALGSRTVADIPATGVHDFDHETGLCSMCTSQESTAEYVAGTGYKITYSPAITVTEGCATYNGQAMSWMTGENCWAIVTDTLPASLNAAFGVNTEATADVIDTTGTAEEKIASRGDLNANGSFNIVDAQIAYDLATGKYATNTHSSMMLHADVNKDGFLDALDAWAIQVAVMAR